MDHVMETGMAEYDHALPSIDSQWCSILSHCTAQPGVAKSNVNTLTGGTLRKREIMLFTLQWERATTAERAKRDNSFISRLLPWSTRSWSVGCLLINTPLVFRGGTSTIQHMSPETALKVTALVTQLLWFQSPYFLKGSVWFIDNSSV